MQHVWFSRKDLKYNEKFKENKIIHLIMYIQIMKVKNTTLNSLVKMNKLD